MSLFENEDYRWRETYFVLFHEANRPAADAIVQGLQKVNARYQISNVRATEAGLFESLTLISADDYAAMDISYVCGEEVREHTEELVEEMLPLLSAKEKNRASGSLPNTTPGSTSTTSSNWSTSAAATMTTKWKSSHGPRRIARRAENVGQADRRHWRGSRFRDVDLV